MKREDITALFPEATKEQLDQIMAINGADIQHAKSGVEELNTKLQTAMQQLAQAQANAEDYERLKGVETELTDLKAANAVRDMREKVSKATGIPVYLLSGDTEEDCTAWANQLKEFQQSSARLNVPNGGEPGVDGAGMTTAEQFAAWSENVF